MGPSSVKFKDDLIGDSEKVGDIRLERRWKRRYIANQNFKMKSCSKVRKTSRNDPVSLRTKRVDPHYKSYLDTLGKYNCNLSLSDDDVDPQYKMFWENLRSDGNSYVLEVSVEEGINILLKYEEDDMLGGEGKPGKPDNLRNATKRGNSESPENLNDVPAKKRKSTSEPKCKPRTENDNTMRVDLSKKSSSRGRYSSEPKCKPRTETDHSGMDESYRRFLECVREDGNCLVYVHEDGKEVKYEAEEESDSDSEIFVADGDPCIKEGKETPFVTSKLFDYSCIENFNRTGHLHSQFRENLMRILKKPYDQSEYDELLEEIRLRKPLEKHRDLRGRIKSYSLESCSKSYLDHHADLKRKIDAVQGDHAKILNLLRGFFYWLKNLSHDGAFRPWADESCLNVMPQQ